MFPEWSQAWWKFLMLALSAGEQKKWASLVQKGHSLLITYIPAEHALTLVCHRLAASHPPSFFMVIWSTAAQLLRKRIAIKNSKENKKLMSCHLSSTVSRRELACQKIIVTGIHTLTSHAYHHSLHSQAKLKVVNHPCPVLFHLWYSHVSQHNVIWVTARAVFPILL